MKFVRGLQRVLQRVLLLASLMLITPLVAQPVYSFKDKIKEATAGDFIVTQQGKHYSLLLIHFVSADALILEEISTPALPKTDWQSWLDARAPGHSSWVMYEINLRDQTLVESYSFSQKKWLYLQEDDYLLVKLLSLPLTKTPPEKRRRIGPPPLGQESDNRAFWSPAVIFEGKKRERPKLESLQTSWPDDASKLSGCAIELYFDNATNFPLPFWVEVQSPHYTFKLRTVDAGKNLVSPLPRLPKRAPLFIGKPERKADMLTLKLNCPAYYKNLHLFALDLSTPLKETIPIPHSMQRDGEIATLRIPLKELQTLLKQGHRYQWITTPENTSDIYTEMPEFFLWNSH